MLWWTLRQLKSLNPEIRIKAVRSLEAERNRKAVPALSELLQDEDPDLRLAVIEALGGIGHGACAEPLAAALSRPAKKNETNAATERESISRALCSLGADAVRPLVRALESEDKEARRWAAITLGIIGDSQAVEPLIRTLEDSRSEVRKSAIVALGRIGDARIAGALIRALAHRDFETRCAAAEALGLLRSTEGVDALIKAAADSNETVQIAASKALGRMGGLAAARCLHSMVFGTKKSVSEAAASALKSMVFTPENPEQRAEVAVIRGDYAAAANEGEMAVPFLTKALEYKDPDTRMQAIQALASIGSPHSVQPLLGALKDHAAAVQEAAGRALIKLGDPARAGLEKLLEHYDASSVRVAAAALGAIGSPLSAGALADLVSENAVISGEYPELFDAVNAAADSLAAILSSSGAGISIQELKAISNLPEAVQLSGPSPKTIDLAGIRRSASDELLHRKS